MAPAAIPLDLSSPLRLLPGIGPLRAARLAEAGALTVGDLLAHLPVRYEDRRRVLRVDELTAPGPVTLHGRLGGARAVRLRRRGARMLRATLHDASGTLGVVWFDRPRLPAAAEAGEEVLLHGRLREARGGGLELLNPSCEALGSPLRGGALQGGGVVPVYRRLGGLGPAALRRLVAACLARLEGLRAARDPLPDELLERHALPSLGTALAALHAPGADADLALLERRRSPGHRRLIYGELLEQQLALALLRARQQEVPKERRYPAAGRLRELARELLPFALTPAQQRAAGEIAADLASPPPMLRLLQGDVGSGKTAVALLALAVVLESGYQAAFMAPTELLAEQHYRTLGRLLGDRYRPALVTASAPDGDAARCALARGDARLAVGTHALIEEGIELPRLALVVIDEQHRFGVGQRRRLGEKGERPDLLVMTATPIPRSLALTAYGDLELSLLDEGPPGRAPVATELVPAGRRREVYRRLRDELATGGRAYVVFPLIDEGEGSDAASLAALGRQVGAWCPETPSAVLHGRLPAAERERVMTAFAAGEVRLLLATTVVEVGLDVPEASWMVIEGAERFGLAQLHQLRGRVGRGARPSRCIALHGGLGEDARRRLDAFVSLTDGFALAEADLALRGPGDLLGSRQAGLPALAVADPRADQRWLLAARDDARQLLARLEEPALARLRRRAEALAAAASGAPAAVSPGGTALL